MGRHGLDLEAGQAARSDVGSDGGGEGRGDRNRRRWRRSDLESGEDKVWGEKPVPVVFFSFGLGDLVRGCGCRAGHIGLLTVGLYRQEAPRFW